MHEWQQNAPGDHLELDDLQQLPGNYRTSNALNYAPRSNLCLA
jgi:hypothetical protein